MVTSSFRKLNFNKKLIPFWGVVFFIISVLISVFFAIFSHVDLFKFINIMSDPYISHVVLFTLWQASICTILAIIISVPASLALHRRKNFWGRKIFIKFINLAFIVPTVVLVLGIIMVHGKNGWINDILNFFNIENKAYLYGMNGIIIGHLAFCLPLCIQIFLRQLGSIPDEMWRLAWQFNFSPFQIFKNIDWPFLRPAVISCAILVFIMCFNSFLIILSLGGGPAVSTIEVEIYQALRFDFNLSNAANLCLIQCSICGAFVVFTHKFYKPILDLSFFLNVTSSRPDNDKLFIQVIDFLFILVVVVLCALPIISVVITGSGSKLFTAFNLPRMEEAFFSSVGIAFSSGIITIIVALILSSGAFHFKYKLNKAYLADKIYLLGNIYLFIPTFVFSTGLFIIFNNFVSLANVAFPLIVFINVVSSLPFVLSIILPKAMSFSSQEIKICESFAITKWNFFRLIFWPKLRNSIANALALSITISWGDLSLIALFSSNDLTTLPYLLYHMINRYRFEEASAVALIILALSFFLFLVIEEILSEEKNANSI
jgi:thiamine transport system permease protein